MSDKNLEIGMSLNKQPAIDGIKSVVEAQRQANATMAADAQAAKKQEITAAKAHVDEQIRGMQKIRDAHGRFIKTSADESAASYRKMGESGRVNFGLLLGGVTAVGAALAGVRAALAAVAAEFDKVGQKAREQSQRLAGERDTLRELAALRGEQPSSAFAAKVAREGSAVFQSFAESRDFQTGFFNSGAQFQDRVGKPQFEKFRNLTAAYLTAKGAPAEQGGDLAGSFLGFRDYSRLPEQARAETAASDLNRAYAILQAGKGDAATLTRQFSMVGASMLKEPEFRGAYSTVDDATIAMSMAAESNPHEIYTSLRAMHRGLTAFNDPKSAQLLAKAGIRPGMGDIEAIQRLAPVVQSEAARRNIPMSNLLAEAFPQAEVKDAIDVQISRGVIGGGYAQRRGVASQAGGFAGFQQVIDDFGKGETGQDRIASANLRAAEMDRASKDASLEILRKQALTSLVQTGRIDTNAAGVQDLMNSKITFGLIGSAEQKRIDDEAQQLLSIRAPDQAKQFRSNSLFATPQERTDELNSIINAALAKNINPLQPASGEAGKIDTSSGIFIKDNFIRDLFAIQPQMPGPTSYYGGQGDAVGVLKSIEKKMTPAVPRPLVNSPKAVTR